MSFQSKIRAARSTKRTHVLMTAMLITQAGTRRVTVRDISRKGAHLIGVERGLSECDAIFCRGDLFTAARVAWVKGSDAGVHFYRELSREEFEGMLPPALLKDLHRPGDRHQERSAMRSPS